MARVGIDVGGTFIDLVLETARGSGPHREGALRARRPRRRDHRRASAGCSSRSGDAARRRRGGDPRDDPRLQRRARTARPGHRAPDDARVPGRPPDPAARSATACTTSRSRSRCRLVPRSRTWEVDERSLADGSVLRPLDEDGIRAAAAEMRAAGVETVAGRVPPLLPPRATSGGPQSSSGRSFPGCHVTISSDVSAPGPRVRAHEHGRRRTRTSPRPRRLPGAARRGAARGWGSRPHSGSCSRAAASAPASGRSSSRCGRSSRARRPARHVRLPRLLAGHPNVISLDMGGTTAKAAVIRDGRPATTRRFELERRELRPGSGLPLDIPAIDLVEISGGGGSIAHESFGVLRVGPRSAGADPGPACYGRGGSPTRPSPTRTFCSATSNADYFAGGAMKLDREAAERAVGRLAEQLGLPLLARRVGHPRGREPRDGARDPARLDRPRPRSA